MKEKDDNSKLTSANNTDVNSESSDFQQNDRTTPIAHICSKSGYNDSDKMGEVIRRWESSRYGI
jgi:hypothetical protein